MLCDTLGRVAYLSPLQNLVGTPPCLVVYALVVRVLRKNFVVLVNRGKF